MKELNCDRRLGVQLLIRWTTIKNDQVVKPVIMIIPLSCNTCVVAGAICVLATAIKDSKNVGALVLGPRSYTLLHRVIPFLYVIKHYFSDIILA